MSSLAGIDVRTDEWGVDLCMTGSQKCLAAPLGMALVSVSGRAWTAMERRRQQGVELRLRPPALEGALDPGVARWPGQDGTPRRQPVSIPTHLTAAMTAAVRLILDEGLAHRFRRHEVAATALRAGLAAM